MDSQKLAIYLLTSLFCLMITVRQATTEGFPASTNASPQPSTNASPQPSATPSANASPQPSATSSPGETQPTNQSVINAVQCLQNLMWAAIVVTSVFALVLAVLLIILTMRNYVTLQQLEGALDGPNKTLNNLTNDLTDRPTRKQLQSDIANALADRPPRQQLKDALADHPTRQELQGDLTNALADRPTRQQLQADIATALGDRPTRQQLRADIAAALADRPTR
jgi:hypothetical protein